MLDIMTDCHYVSRGRRELEEQNVNIEESAPRKSSKGVHGIAGNIVAEGVQRGTERTWLDAWAVSRSVIARRLTGGTERCTVVRDSEKRKSHGRRRMLKYDEILICRIEYEKTYTGVWMRACYLVSLFWILRVCDCKSELDVWWDDRLAQCWILQVISKNNPAQFVACTVTAKNELQKYRHTALFLF